MENIPKFVKQNGKYCYKNNETQKYINEKMENVSLNKVASINCFEDCNTFVKRKKLQIYRYYRCKSITPIDLLNFLKECF